MKFDVAITNPPYCKNLHLDILSELVPIANEIINISPTVYLKDLPAICNLKKTTWHKYEESVSKHIARINPFNAEDANDLFDIGSYSDIDIIALDAREHNLYKHIWELDIEKSLSIFNKVVIKYCVEENNNFLSKFSLPKTKYFTRMSGIHGHPGNIDMVDILTPNSEFAFSDGPQDKIYFNTQAERDNFYKSCQTNFMRYINYLSKQGQHIHFELLPFMNDYTREWKDKDFYKFFDLDSNEIEKIDIFANKYKREPKTLF